jgi:signal transduction histidine kinase
MLLGIRWGSMRLKIIAWSFVPTAVILMAVALVMFVAYQQVTADLVIERDQDVTRLAASQLTAELTEYTGILSALARTADIYRSDSSVQQAALKRASNLLVVFDGGVLILDPFGRVMAAEPERPDALGYDWSDRAYFQASLRTSEPVFSNIVADGWQGRPVIAVAVPITDDQGAFKGTLIGLFRLGEITISPFYGSIVKLRLAESGDTYLVDGRGRLIYHSDPDRISEDLSGQTVVQQVLADQVGAIRTRDYDGRDIVAGYAPVPGTPWGLVTEESWATLFQASQGYRQFLLFLLGLGIIVPALVVTAGVTRLTKPVVELIEAAQTVAGGNFDQMITVNTGDELEELAKHFNLMAAQLQASYANLEQRVADRTKELATINAIAAVVSRSLDLEEILQDALDKTLEVRGMEAGAALRLVVEDAERRSEAEVPPSGGLGGPAYREETQVLHLIAQRGLSTTLREYLAQLPLPAGAAAQAVNEERPVLKQVAHYPQGEWRELLVAEGWQQVVSIPLIVKGRTLGVINLFSQTVHDRAPEELSLLAAIGQQIGVAVENAELYEQAQKLAAAEERQRLARDLHDSVTQALYGVTLYAEAAARLLASGEAALATEHVKEMRALAREALREVRLLIFELRPPVLEQEGLVVALQARLEAVEGRSGMRANLQVEGLEEGQRLPLDLETGLYRIAQEALNNALKHAQADQVTVYLRQCDHQVMLAIADDGQGFDPITAPKKGGMGLCNMHERASLLGGKLTVESQPGAGTKIQIEVNR